MNNSISDTGTFLRWMLAGVGNVITLAAAVTVWFQLSLHLRARAPMALPSQARLRRGRVG
ncbi:MAG: hypothetical protein JWR16_718 [Nevskia sp.]|nr:hypothetical protein [Nevskia sp.]